MQKSENYDLSWSQQHMIATASALHDIGKIGIDEKILNKPGKLTKEEFEAMKHKAKLPEFYLQEENLEKIIAEMG